MGSLGLNALFMKFSRNAENEADRVGARMMASAGYDPMGMASFFDLLAAQQRRTDGGGGVLQQPPLAAEPVREHPGRGRASRRGRDDADRRAAGVQARLDRMPAPRRQASLRMSRLRGR